MSAAEQQPHANLASAPLPAFERILFESAGTACRTPAGDLSRAAFLDRVEGIAETVSHLEGDGLLACADTLNFAIGFCALLRAGRNIVMPPNLQPETLAGFGHCLRVDDDFVAAQPSLPLSQPAAFEPDLRVTLFTSGSTGQPKLIEKRLRQLSAEADILEATFGARLSGADVAATVPHIHIYGMLFRVIWPLAAGRPFITETPLGGNLPAGTGHALVSSPAFLGRIQPQRLAATQPELVFSSGGRLPEDRARELATVCNAALIEVYGSTETGGIAWRAWQPDSDGLWTPFENVQGELDEDAILKVRSAATNSDWILTGDRVRLKHDGRFELEGRADGVLKIEDKRVSPRALAERIESLDWVAEARIVELAGRRRQLGAIVRLGEAGGAELVRHGRASCISLLREHLLTRFDAVVVPRRWRFVEEFPLNAMGKTTVADLAALFETGEDA